MIGCGKPAAPINPSAATLNIGFGLATDQSPEAGIRPATQIISLEGLVAFGRDGRPQPWLAESWSLSPDGKSLTVRLRHGMRFHDGDPVTASVIREIVAKALPAYLGPAFDDVSLIRATSEHELEFVMARPSAFLLEGLDALIQKPGSPLIGTGPFFAIARDDGIAEMRANPNYHGGPPVIQRIVFKPYASVRAAWADMLRGQVDMLYEVGTEAKDLIENATGIRVFTFQRSYVSAIILNTAAASLKDKRIRQQLNAAIDRQAIVSDVLRGLGIPAQGPVSPYHWAYDPTLPRFTYAPQLVSAEEPIRFTCLVSEPSQETLALVVQRQLRASGIYMELQQAPLQDAVARVKAGDFEAFLIDAVSGPTIVRPYLFWHSQGPYNLGQYRSPAVDAALNAIRHAPDDDSYRAGVAEFERAIQDDPPAIFLAWSERARAVSTRFEVPVEPGRDILSTLRLWRPAPADN